ncbi:MAG TPA: NAD-dependent epimerase/dehydratase family protein [Bryobacteraceae bacterium]|jgi:nucleoside-diphosphate-sugar epimerase|nr:NAD-dependent epimerase/dehydratase family protein [Bryobacteraceae bacterium]
MHNVLVIGGSGFVGSALIPALKAAGYDVSLLNRGNRLVPGTRQITVDRNDERSMLRSSRKFDVVMDTSAYTGRQTEVAFRAFGPYTRLWIHLGSAAVYRETPGRMPTEEDPIGGAAVFGQYGQDKSQAEDFLLRDLGTSTLILRPPYLYGPGNDNDWETFVWSRVLRNVPVIMPGQGRAMLQFLHVADLAQLLCSFVAGPWERKAVYNVAEPTTITASAWVSALSDIAGKEAWTLLGGAYAADFSARAYFPFRDYDCVVDTRKLFSHVDWQPRYGLLDGFRQTFRSYTLIDLLQRYTLSPVELEIISRIQATEPSSVCKPV